MIGAVDGETQEEVVGDVFEEDWQAVEVVVEKVGGWCLGENVCRGDGETVVHVAFDEELVCHVAAAAKVFEGGIPQDLVEDDYCVT